MYAGSETFSATGNSAEIPTDGSALTTFSVSGTWAGSIALEGSIDGTVFFAVSFFSYPFFPRLTSLSENGLYMFPAAGMKKVRISASSITSGSVNLAWSNSASSPPTPPLITKSSSYQTGNGTTTVKSGKGVLCGFLAGNDNENATYIFYDNTAGSGTILTSFTTGSPSGGLLSTSGIRCGTDVQDLNIFFNTGLTVVRSGGSSTTLTVLYR